MKIKVIAGKKGSWTLLDKHFGLISELVKRYPNAIWKKCYGKNGESRGYELEI
jgi:hypothetical protein